GGRCLSSILEDAGGLQRPLIALLVPGTFTKAARRVKEPGADVLRGRIPADPHGGVPDRNVLGGGRERGHNEVLVLSPIKRKPFDLARVGTAGPLADSPLQPA